MVSFLRRRRRIFGDLIAGLAVVVVVCGDCRWFRSSWMIVAGFECFCGWSFGRF